MYVDAEIERRDVSKIAARAVELSQALNPLGFAIEANQFQTLLARNIAEAGRVAGFAPPIYEIINTLAKVIRIRSLTPYLSRGELRFKRGSRGAIALVDQLVAFPSADYDDGPDALEMCVRLARHLITGAELKAIPSIRGR